jgi:hypothetical protein
MDYCDLELIALNSLASNANSCSSLVSTNTEQSGFYSDALARSLLYSRKQNCTLFNLALIMR